MEDAAAGNIMAGEPAFEQAVVFSTPSTIRSSPPELSSREPNPEAKILDVNPQSL